MSDRFFIHKLSHTREYSSLRYVVLHDDDTREVMTDRGPVTPQTDFLFRRAQMERLIQGDWWLEVTAEQAAVKVVPC